MINTPAIKKNCYRYHFLLQKCSKNVRKCSKMLNFMKISWYLSRKCKILWDMSKNICFGAQSRLRAFQQYSVGFITPSELGEDLITKSYNTINWKTLLWIRFGPKLLTEVKTPESNAFGAQSRSRAFQRYPVCFITPSELGEDLITKSYSQMNKNQTFLRYWVSSNLLMWRRAL